MDADQVMLLLQGMEVIRIDILVIIKGPIFVLRGNDGEILSIGEHIQQELVIIPFKIREPSEVSIGEHGLL